MTQLSLIIPVYNEHGSIDNTLAEIRKAFADSDEKIEYEIVVVDDGSDDHGCDHLEESEDLHLVIHKQNRGYGAALKSGIRAAKGDIIGITDADGTYPNWFIPELYRKMRENKDTMTVAARTGEKVHIPLIRRPAKIALNILANYMTSTKIPDLNSGLRLFKKDIAQKFFHIISDGFSFTTTITLAMLVNNYNVSFIPIDYAPRKGTSKIKPFRDTLNFVILIVRTIAFFNPLKIFLPVSIVLFLLAIACLITQIVTGDVGDFSVILFLSSLQIFLIGIIADLIARKP